MYENNLPTTSDLSYLDTPTNEPSKIWLWAGIAIVGYYLLKGDKKKPKAVGAEYEYVEEPSQTPADLHGLNDLPDEMYNLEQSTMEYDNFDDWMRGELSLDPAVFGSMKLIELKDRLMDHIEKRRKRQYRVKADSAQNEALEYGIAHDTYIAKGIPVYIPKLRNMTLRQTFEMAKSREQQPTWERKRKMIPEEKGQMTLFGGLSGTLRTCDAWFQTKDKHGKTVNRCFIYKPACKTKGQRCKIDTGVSRETSSEMQGIEGVEDLDKSELQRFKDYVSQFRSKELFADSFDSIPKTKAKKAIDWYRSQIFDIKDRFPFSEKNKQYARGQINAIESHIENIPKELEDYTFEELWNIGKSFESKPFTAKEQLTLFGNLKGYTATCKKWTKNRLGHRSCAKFAPTCGSKDEGCRDIPAPLPSEVGKRTERDYEIEADALAQELANEKNFEIDYNKKLMREILDYGGIAPHKSGFMAEEYRQIPKKYKRADGVPMDELAQEMGIDESTLADRIYQAEASFQELKNMRGGATARKFKKSDFIDEAWDRMRSGRGFMGFGESWLTPGQKAVRGKIHGSSGVWTVGKEYPIMHPSYTTAESYKLPKGYVFKPMKYEKNPRTHKVYIATYMIVPEEKANKNIPEKAGQMTLFGRLPIPKMRMYAHG